MDLFTHRLQKERTGQPLAERMRPRDLFEVVGQPQLLGPSCLLRQIFEQSTQTQPAAAFLPSLIFWGPPGSGKTTLGQLLAKQVGARFSSLSAVQSGVKELRQCIEQAQEALATHAERTVLFIDEIHRYSKSQQDALLPHVESGVVTLIGATTENPSFELTQALLSRCRVLRLQGLLPGDLDALLTRAINDKERGLGRFQVVLSEQVRQMLLTYANGDARRLLSTLEAAVYLCPQDASGQRQIERSQIEQALAQRVLAYDKSGEQHYDLTSALIKSLRGSDPDAALYYMTRMLEAGEDPLFVLRRMVILAAEDIGVADPRALPMAMSTVEAVRFVGMPEAVLLMSSLCIFLATAPKSNSALLAYSAARAAVQEQGDLPVPLHLRDGHSAAARALGHGQGYLYPHDFPGQELAQSYLPKEISTHVYYRPLLVGYERQLAERHKKPSQS